MARSVADASALLVALATEPGIDPDGVVTALPLSPRGGRRPLEGLRVAVTGRPEAADAEADVLDGLQDARLAVERLGARVVELEAAPDVEPQDSVTILFHEVWPYHEAHVERRDRYRPSIREFVDLAEEVHDPAAYEAAQRRRAELTGRWRAWFVDHDLDLLLEPTVPTTALARGHGYDSGNLGGEGDPLIVLTSTWNFTGFPVVAVPAGLGARSGLPVGVSLIGVPDSEPLLVQAAIDLQEHELPPLRLDADR
jgi:aspartyl-tRNA(Asn)/glutamyl-tRNA(Gln) amidotransferase subunit A